MEKDGADYVLWYFVSVFALFTGTAGIIFMHQLNAYQANIFVVFIFCHHGLLLYSFSLHRYVQQKCLGNLGKLAVDVIVVFAALALRQLWDFSIFYLMVLVGFTVDLHAVAHSFNIAYDDNVWDVLLGSLMQILVYTVPENRYMVTVLFVLCGGVIYYRYAFYSPPDIPVYVNLELEKQAC